MKLHSKHHRLLSAALLAVIVTWAPWIVYAAIGNEEEGFDLIAIIYLLIIPALGLLLPACEMIEDRAPDWVTPIIDFVLYPDWEWLIFLWILPVAALIWAMTVLGARGKWSLAITATIGLAFQIASVYFYHHFY